MTHIYSLCCMFLKYNLILFTFNFQRPKAETKFRQRLVTDGRVSAQDASAATWIMATAGLGAVPPYHTMPNIPYQSIPYIWLMGWSRCASWC